MPIIHDDEFGKVTVRKSAKATSVRIRVAPDGSLRVSAPVYTPLFFVRRLLKSSRKELQAMVEETQPVLSYQSGSQIGKSHTLVVREGTALACRRHGQQIILTLPPANTIEDADVQRLLRHHIIAALRIEAKSYLPKRLLFLATQHGFSYERARFSHASGRWGSCSSTGTISLNIALMKLPFELIDYVIIHELAHTIHMNHSSQFWDTVAKYDPSYKLHRAALKREAPIV